MYKEISDALDDFQGKGRAGESSTFFNDMRDVAFLYVDYEGLRLAELCYGMDCEYPDSAGCYIAWQKADNILNTIVCALKKYPSGEIETYWSSVKKMALDDILKIKAFVQSQKKATFKQRKAIKDRIKLDQRQIAIANGLLEITRRYCKEGQNDSRCF